MKDFPKIAVLGAGVSGTMLAWQLLCEGYPVEIFEARAESDRTGAGYVAAAMLSPLAEAAGSEAYIGAMGLASMALWKPLIQKLELESSPIFFQRDGTIVIWHPDDRAEHQILMRQLSQYVDTLPSSKTHLPYYQSLEASTINALEPALAGRFSTGLLLEGEGQVDNIQVMKNLRSAIVNRGGIFHWESPRRIEEVIDQSKPVLVIDARGIGAKKEWVPSPLRGIRGEVLRVKTTEVSLKRPIRLLHPRYPLYIAPKPSNEFVIGATVIESEDESPISLQSTMELASALYAVHPAFAEARLLASMTSLRPTLPDHRPHIHLNLRGHTPVVSINGLYRHGWLLAPIIVKSALMAIHEFLRSLSKHSPWINLSKIHEEIQSKSVFPDLFTTDQ